MPLPFMRVRAAPRTDPSERNQRTRLLPWGLAAKRSSGQGCRIFGVGIQRTESRCMRYQVRRLRWPRLRRANSQHSTIPFWNTLEAPIHFVLWQRSGQTRSVGFSQGAAPERTAAFFHGALPEAARRRRDTEIQQRCRLRNARQRRRHVRGAYATVESRDRIRSAGRRSQGAASPESFRPTFRDP